MLNIFQEFLPNVEYHKSKKNEFWLQSLKDKTVLKKKRKK